MQNLIDLYNKNSLNILGILSGTSVDSVDIVLVNFKEIDKKISFSVENFDSFSINPEIKKNILDVANNLKSTEEVCKINFLIGYLFADCINKFLKKHKINKEFIDLIGSHGQTIYHIPQLTTISNYHFKSTLQAGDISVISNLTGIPVVGDFRTADMALDGEGAPLVSYLDYNLLKSNSKNRILLNLGGIANLSYINKKATLENVISFDCGPANMLIDLSTKLLLGKEYDYDGKIAESGKLNPELFNYLVLLDDFHKQKYPKSTGREYYKNIFSKIIESYKNIKPEDLINTITEFSVYCINYNIENFINGEIDEIIVSGGGSKNKFIMKRLDEIFKSKNIRITELNENGLNSENKEAVLFAFLAFEFIKGRMANIPSVTGAKQKTILGKLSPV